MAKLQPQYAVGDNNEAAKLFREDFHATAPMFEVGITEILNDHAASKDKDKELTITEKMIKRKMHELLFNEGMGAFKNRKASAKGKEKCKELLPAFYEEMVVKADKKAPAPQKNAAPKKTTAKKTAPKKAADKKAATGKSSKPGPGVKVYETEDTDA